MTGALRTPLQVAIDSVKLSCTNPLLDTGGRELLLIIEYATGKTVAKEHFVMYVVQIAKHQTSPPISV